MLIIRTCRNVETYFEHLSVTFQKTGFDNLPDLIGRTEYGTSKSYAVDNPKYRYNYQHYQQALYLLFNYFFNKIKYKK